MPDQASNTIVLQSQARERLEGWQGRCCESVRSWAEVKGFAYRFEADELFGRVPAELRRCFAEQPAVLADLARLQWLKDVLSEGFARAIWVDADVLLFRDFDLAGPGDYLGREVWIQGDLRRPRSFRKVHNAWLQFHRDSVFLPYYIDRASALLQRAKPPVVPQFIGPKLLTAWHNIAAFNVEERIGMSSPLVTRELLGLLRDGPGTDTPALRLLADGHRQGLCGLNLCASYENRTEDGVHHGPADYDELIDGLLAQRLDDVLPEPGA